MGKRSLPMSKSFTEFAWANKFAHAIRLALLVAMSGCASPPTDHKLMELVSAGEHGRARVHVLVNLTEDERDRNYLLDRFRLGIASLADGVPASGELAFEEAYDKLRAQGLNKDKTLAVIMAGDQVTFWKGEPFEQAMAFHYTSVWNAMQGQWGNARAAAGNSLFYLKDFGTDAAGGRLQAEGIIRRAGAWERDPEQGDYIETGYVAAKSNFALGYLMNAIANDQLGRPDEARDNYREAVDISARLEGLVGRLEGGGDNTILIVDYGLGPHKIARGPDGAIADFVPTMSSDPNRLVVAAAGRTDRYPVVCDLNAMAADHMWKGIEDVRIAKSQIGTVLLVAGTGVAAHGTRSNSDAAAAVGLAMMLAGAIQKATARADTTYCEIVPQRVYVAPVTIRGPEDTIELQIEGIPDSRLALSGIHPPGGGAAQLLYVRLPSHTRAPLGWATTGAVYYCNDETPGAGRVHLPYILGGDCVCTPSETVLSACQAAGYLEGLTVSDLRELYRFERITIADRQRRGPGLHILEGGNWLFTPVSGTAGFARLYGQRHRPYKPKSPQVRMLAERVKSAQVMASN
jgi:tetratricopeptide (TPR) repeat protein